MVSGELATALAKVQAELPAIAKGETADAGTYSYAYADLTAITKPLMPLLGEHGLAFIAKPTLWTNPADPVDVRFVLAYSLLHVSGEREDGVYPLPNGNPQTIGSAISYGRRYCLCAVTGVAPGGSDDDGAAAGATEVRMDRPTQPPADPAVMAAEQALAEAKGLVWDVWKAQHDGVGDALMFKAAYEQFASAPLDEAGVDELRSFRLHLASAKPEAEQTELPESTE
jgi:hypothetical protein